MMQYIDGVFKLVIYDFDFVDVGLYECYVENEYGNDKCIIFVKIKRVRNRFSLFFFVRINEFYFLVYFVIKFQIQIDINCFVQDNYEIIECLICMDWLLLNVLLCGYVFCLECIGMMNFKCGMCRFFFRDYKLLYLI